ncbi:hypothetical protein [Paraburkholderia sp. C35]|uniref:hypothetical protein n=1 Tax=Paraburkholderia sp. C35 TaxID=2126993 RepID=UPI000D69BE95|nr:hypothetical protein [Paraburkholderia sp. C35]
MKQIKTLVVGSLRHDHVTSVTWANLQAVNVLDYHIVVLFLPSLDEAAINSIGGEALFQMQRIFAQFLASNGEIYVLGAPPLAGESHGQWLWCPVPLISLAQRGDTVEIHSAEFKNLLARLKAWDCVYRVHPHQIAQSLSMVLSQGMAPIQFEYEPYAQNRAGGVLAAKFTYFSETHGGRHEWPGSITVLPHFPTEEPRSIVSTALVDILGKPQSEGAPDWLSSIPMSSVIPINRRIAELLQEIAELESQVEQQLSEKARVERYKRLLYVSSFELEDLVAECLDLLGATIKPARYSQEEFVMEWRGAVFLAECKGVAKSVSLAHLRQVQDYVLKYEEDEGAAGKGILFGNAWRDLPPNERNTNDRPVFPKNVIERAQQFGVSLVSSVDLFYAISRFLNGEIRADEILDVVTNANGVADFRPLMVI